MTTDKDRVEANLRAMGVEIVPELEGPTIIIGMFSGCTPIAADFPKPDRVCVKELAGCVYVIGENTETNIRDRIKQEAEEAFCREGVKVTQINDTDSSIGHLDYPFTGARMYAKALQLFRVFNFDVNRDAMYVEVGTVHEKRLEGNPIRVACTVYVVDVSRRAKEASLRQCLGRAGFLSIDHFEGRETIIRVGKAVDWEQFCLAYADQIVTQNKIRMGKVELTRNSETYDVTLNHV